MNITYSKSGRNIRYSFYTTNKIYWVLRNEALNVIATRRLPFISGNVPQAQLIKELSQLIQSEGK